MTIQQIGTFMTAEAEEQSFRSLGYVFRNGVKTYCCYGKYSGAGHSLDCKYCDAPGVIGVGSLPTPQPAVMPPRLHSEPVKMTFVYPQAPVPFEPIWINWSERQLYDSANPDGFYMVRCHRTNITALVKREQGSWTSPIQIDDYAFLVGLQAGYVHHPSYI